MPLGMILRRMWRERRLLSVLLLAIVLVTGFFSLGPLYVRGVSEAGVRYALENTAPEQLNILLSNPEPIQPEAWDLLNAELGGVVTDLVTRSRSAGNVCGFVYELGRPTTVFTGRTPNCYYPASYSNLESIFTLAAGRWPVRLALPEDVTAAGLSDTELSQQQLGVYSRGQVEAVITTTAAAQSNLEIGNRFVIGNEPDETAIVRIVGLVDPALSPEDPFWAGQRVIIDGEWVPIGLFDQRYDFGVIVPQGAFDDWIAPVTEGNTYVWQMQTNLDVVHADTLDTLEQRLVAVESGLRAQHPDMLVFSGLTNLITEFRRGLTETEGPILLLSGAVLILMLYHLVTTVALVLEQQSNEWAAITSRGGSLWQLLSMQFGTMAVLGVVGFAVGPFIAQGILLVMERVGPLARTLNGASLGVQSLPGNIFVLSGAAALASVVVLTLPAWPAARRSLLRLKQLISRPPTQPAWARYFLDFALLAVGFGFMLRLYFLISGDVGSSLEALLQDPASLIRLIAAGADEVGGLNDPFNLFGPALVLTGAALLWLRVFPLLMHLFGWLFRRSNGLTLPMALWSVERDPGHYAQLVLLLIGTLALGTASLALSATRDAGAWAVAQQETGGYVRLETSPWESDPAQDWTTLPDVTAGASVLVAQTPQRAGQQQVTIVGVDTEPFIAAFPAWERLLNPLRGQTPPQRPGLMLPEDAVELTAQVYAEASDEPTETRIAALFIDDLGVPLELVMETANPFDAGQFVTYTAALPEDLGAAPWRLIGFRMMSNRGELQDFSHTVYIDDLRVYNAEDAETVLEDFETVADPYPWVRSSRRFQLDTDLRVAQADAYAADGAYSLRVAYRIRRVGGGVLEPEIAVNEAPDYVVPVVVSRAFADYYGERSVSRQPLTLGDEDRLEVELELGPTQVQYRVVGIVEDFPTLDARDHFIVAATESIRPILNANTTLRGYYDRNRVWLETESREPSEDFRFAAAGMPGVTDVVYAWDRYNDIQRSPLPNAITGMLFAGFWVSLGLSVLDFGFYLAVTARRRAISFAVLQAMGWEARNIWSLLAVEQAALVTPALLVGVGLGAGLAYLLLPFLELIGGEALLVPLPGVAGLLVALVAVFTLLLGITAVFLRRQQVHQVLRMGEE